MWSSISTILDLKKETEVAREFKRDTGFFESICSDNL